MKPAADAPLRRSERRLLLGVLAVALGARLIAIGPFASAPPVFDETYYLNVAVAIADGRGHTWGIPTDPSPGALRPPLFPAVLAGAMWMFGPRPAACRLLQVALSLVTVWAVFRIAASRFGPRPAAVSGLACALQPSLVHYSHFLWAENLATMLLAVTFLFADRFDRGGRLRDLALAGVALGLTALTKEVWAYFGLVFAGWVVVRAGARWRDAVPAAAVLLAALAVTILPWTARNYRALGQVVPISTNRWFPLAMGNLFDPEHYLRPTPEDVRKAVIRRGKALPRAEREAFWRKVALGLIREQQPWWIFRKLARTPVTLYNVRTQQLRFVERGWIRPSRATAWTLIATDLVGTFATLALGFLALWIVPGGHFKALVVLAVLFLHGVHVLANAVPRFYVPLLPLLALYVGPLLLGTFERGRVRRWQWAGALASVAVLALLPLPRSIAFLEKLLAQVATLS